MTTTDVHIPVVAGPGVDADRPDGPPKVQGDFAFASDLFADDMLWGATLRSPHAHARVRSIDTAAALAMPGVFAVLTGADVPGRKLFGLEVPDQPVLADDEVRYWAQPVAVVAAEDPFQARRAADAIVVTYDVLKPQCDPEIAVERGDLFRHMTIRRGDQSATGDVAVEGYYEVGTQDQAPLGTEAGLAIPDDAGGVDLFVATQWTHADHEQIAASLGIAGEKVRVHPAGVGGAFGAREDISLQIHLCLLALHTGRPVKMVYDRSESFVGHVHRHPARMWYRHEANRDGTLVRVEAKIVLDGGGYASTSSAVIANASYFAVGPYACSSVTVDGFATRTNNPPCGAMRGFGAVQACFGHESQMDRLAAALGMDGMELRRHNALESGGQMATTGQVIDTSLPTRAVIDRLVAIPLPDDEPATDPRRLPGGTGLTTPPARVRRGVGYALGLKNLAFSEGFDDFAEARVVLTEMGAQVHTAAVEVGQGLAQVLQQIVRTVLGISSVAVVFEDTSAIGSAGSTSASRQTQMTGGAVLEAAEEVLRDVLGTFDGDRLDDQGVWRDGQLIAPFGFLAEEGPFEYHTRYRHPPTEGPTADGQGNKHVDFAVAGHRAVVDVDPDLGLVRVVRVDTAQDVGIALNPRSVVGQIEGGIMQGVGLAVMEELIVDGGVIRNASFTDYLLPTFADAPDVVAELIEEPGTFGPFGAKGVGEPPTISSTAAVVAAIRAAIGRDLVRAPVRPDDIVFDPSKEDTPRH
ncbi:MAG: molybdopterin-dependent oxidoreductase [Acidimicrobiia bacterium]|nr:molybdopterin-dependent oxidoreductase [Acidimicrobiia bacterium]